jgi:hypothetical protein
VIFVFDRFDVQNLKPRFQLMSDFLKYSQHLSDPDGNLCSQLEEFEVLVIGGRSEQTGQQSQLELGPWWSETFLHST